MPRPKGSRNRATIERERKQMEEKKNLTGQSGAPGEPDPDALKAVEEANRVPENAPVAEVAPPEIPPVNGSAVPVDLAGLMQLLTRPEVASAVVAAASQTAQGKQLLGIPADRAMPSGEGRMNYKRPELRVMGGLEVTHPETWQPNPPGYIKKYVRADGTMTDYGEPHYELRKTTVAKKDAEGRQIVNESGEAVYEEKAVQALIDPGAALDSAGRPLKTDAYKRWLDLWYECKGRRMDGSVSDRPTMQGDDGTPAVQFDANEAPLVKG